MKASTHRSVLRVAALLAAMLCCSLPGLLRADDDEHAGNPAARIGEKFTPFAGSAENATALVTGLHDGTAVTLTATVDGVATTTAFTSAAGQLGYGDTFIALALAKESLTKAGITQPTPAQIVAALNGGSVTGTSGTAVTLPGVLTMRAAGQGWGDIAQTMGVKLGQVVHNLHGANSEGERPEHPSVSKPERIASKFTAFAGSADNAKALVTGLHDGTAVTLTTTVDGVPTTTEFQPATGKLSYRTAALSLSLAEKSLAKAGITQPTPAQIVAALNGGSVTGSTGTAVSLQGVLALRAAGDSWRQVARALDVRLGWGSGHEHHSVARTPGSSKPMEPVAASSFARHGEGFEHAARPVTTRPAIARPSLPTLSQLPRSGRH